MLRAAHARTAAATGRLLIYLGPPARRAPGLLQINAASPPPPPPPHPKRSHCAPPSPICNYFFAAQSLVLNFKNVRVRRRLHVRLERALRERSEYVQLCLGSLLPAELDLLWRKNKSARKLDQSAEPFSKTSLPSSAQAENCTQCALFGLRLDGEQIE